MSLRVYIAHAAKDEEIAARIGERLNRKGNFQTFDRGTLLPGDREQEQELRAIRAAQIIVLLVTQNFIDALTDGMIPHTGLLQERAGDAIIVPCIVHEVKWRDKWFGDFHPFSISENDLTDGINSLDDQLRKIAQQRIPQRRSMERPRRTWAGFRFGWSIAAGVALLASIVLLAQFSATHTLPEKQNSTSNPAPSPGAGIQASAVEVLGNAAAVGIAAMSLLQIARKLTRMRGAFHRTVLGDWLKPETLDELSRKVGPDELRDMLDLPAEMLTGQLGAIAEHELERPAGEAESVELIAAMADGETMQPLGGSMETDQSDRRARLALTIQRNLDHFQIRAAAEWRRYLLLSCMLISMLLFIGLELLETPLPFAHLGTPSGKAERLGTTIVLILEAALVGCFAGFLGSIARDIVAIVEKLRR